MRGGHRRQLFRRTLSDKPSTSVSALGPQVDEVVSRTNHVKVVFDDDDGISFIDKSVEDRQKAPDILEVETGRRLVEHIDGASS